MLLLQYGADPNLARVSNITGLCINNREAMKDTALITAIRKKSFECVHALLKYGANPIDGCEKYICALEYASIINEPAIFDELMAASLRSDYVYLSNFQSIIFRSSIQCANLYLNYGYEYDEFNGKDVIKLHFYSKEFLALLEADGNLGERVELTKRIFREYESEILGKHYYTFLASCLRLNVNWALSESLHKKLTGHHFMQLFSMALRYHSIVFVNYLLQLLMFPVDRRWYDDDEYKTVDSYTLLKNVLGNKSNQIQLSYKDNVSIFNLTLKFVIARCLENLAYILLLSYMLENKNIRRVNFSEFNQNELAFFASYLHIELNEPESLAHVSFESDRITDLYTLRDRIFKYMYPYLEDAIIALDDPYNTDLIITAMVIDYYKQFKCEKPGELLPMSITVILEHIRLRYYQTNYTSTQEIYTYTYLDEKVVTQVEEIVNTETKDVVIPLPDDLAEGFAELSEKFTEAVAILIRNNWIPDPLDATEKMRLTFLQDNLFIGLNEFPQEKTIKKRNQINNNLFSIFRFNETRAEKNTLRTKKHRLSWTG